MEGLQVETGYTGLSGLKGVGGEPLHIDLWIPKYRIAIEIDGQQHRKKGNFRNEDNSQSLKRQIWNDNKKNDYFNNPQVKAHLIRIPTADDIHNDKKSNEEYRMKTAINIIRSLDLELIPLIRRIKQFKHRVFNYRKDSIQ